MRDANHVKYRRLRVRFCGDWRTVGRMELDEKIGRRVHMMLWDRGLTNAALADVLGLARPTVSQRLRGQRPWTIAELYAVADYFDVPVVDLLPRLDSNQEPAGYRNARIIPLRRVAHATAA